MSQLVAIGYPGLDEARGALETLSRLTREHSIELEDAVIAERKDTGKVKLHQVQSPTAAGAAGGAMWGGLIGLVFLMPLLGMAVGAASGAAAGSATDVGVDDDFMRELGAHLEPGNAALFVLFHRATADKVIPEMAEHGGKVLRTSLADDAEQALRDALEARGTGA